LHPLDRALVGVALDGDARHRCRRIGVTIIRHIIVRGRVQGVGYRAFVEHEALRHGVEGWVRNRRDGTVEAVFAAKPEKVDAMIEACRRGPYAAHVEAIDQREGTDSDLALRRPGELFSVLATA
ncbi:MAG: acylphosphatase, partial [Pseudolabrys sp.]